MRYNRKLAISMAGSRKATLWPKSETMWSDFTERLKTPVHSPETLDEYLAMPKNRQADLKDVGGFVGGTFLHERRKNAYVQGRDLLTLDMDNIPAGQTEDILKRIAGLGCAAAVYSTRKHAGYAPRLRAVIPLDRTAAADEYEPAARKAAAIIGIEFCDPTTFDPCRLMYWPSCCADSEFVCQVYDNPFCSLDGLLGMYRDWKDVSEWPQVPGVEATERRRIAKQEDPTHKRGLIGAFCRAYSVTSAMEKFLPGIYEPTDIPGRYTYTGGSTTGGAVVYDGDLFLYSHHATDPCSGQLVNAFDLVRLHKFGDQDIESKEGTPVNKLPSYVQMTRLAKEDEYVAGLMVKERVEQAKYVFGMTDPGHTEAGEPDTDWILKLTKDGNGRIEKTIANVTTVLENDPFLKGRIVTDEFSSCGMTLGGLPWDLDSGKRRWTDVDYAGYYRYMETFYGLTGREKLDNGLLIVSGQNKINDVKEYLCGLKWDGKRRVDTLLRDYLGADDSRYTRAVMRKSLCAAVARAVVGGVKYDYMPIFTGPQGIGKSTFLAILGKSWFSDSLTTFSGKEASELIQGTWINEVGELTAMTKQETSAVKQFLSKTHDIYRAAYGRTTNKYPRRCVFFGTSNDSEFLKDTTGNRRFWPVDVGTHRARKSVWRDLPGETDQIWAEAYMYWMLGEPLFLPKEVEKLAEEQQESHREAHAKEGMVQEFLDKEIPQGWDSLSLMQRRQFYQSSLHLPEGTVLVPREKVCAAEIWQECYGSDLKFMGRRDSMEINSIMRCMKGWIPNKSRRRYGFYGVQRGFERVR